jgi:hypothetical protein
MSTFAYELISTTDDRWREIPLLLGTAAHQSTSDELRDALCRAATVLIVAHFEGFLKYAAKAIIDDINKYSTFRAAPSQVKRVFCRAFTGTGNSGKGSREDNEREEKLINLLEGLDTKVDATPFTGGTSNPKPDVVERICASFGADNVFSLINESKIDIVFTGTDSEAEDVLKEIRGHLLAGLQAFPYKVRPSLFNMDKPTGKSRTGGGRTPTLWEEFVDNLLEQRHVIAHGTSIVNGRSVGEVERNYRKTRLLMHAVLLVMCGMRLSEMR